MSDSFSMSTLFCACFLGALFAIFVALLAVYTYVALRLIPKLKRGIREFVEEHGPNAVFERMNVDPVDVMEQFGVAIKSPQPSGAGAMRIIFTCEDHGRCIGCPKVLAQFEAIIRHQGEDSFDEVERKCYAHLREQLTSDALLPGESEVERQKRLAARIIETLVREGFTTTQVRGVVWAIGKEDRATFAGWLAEARESCSKIEKIVDRDDQERVA